MNEFDKFKLRIKINEVSNSVDSFIYIERLRLGEAAFDKSRNIMYIKRYAVKFYIIITKAQSNLN